MMNNEKLEQIEQLLQTLIKLIQIKRTEQTTKDNSATRIAKTTKYLSKHTKNLGTKRIKKIRTSYRGDSNRLLFIRRCY